MPDANGEGEVELDFSVWNAGCGDARAPLVAELSVEQAPEDLVAKIAKALGDRGLLAEVGTSKTGALYGLSCP